MELSYKLYEKDLFKLNLYTAYQSKLFIKQKRNTIIFFTCILLYLSYIANNEGNSIEVLIYFALAILFVLIYPYFSAYSYNKRGLRVVRDVYSNKIGKTININLKDDGVFVNDDYTETKISLEGFMLCTELKGHFILNLKNGSVYIIPKWAISTDELRIKLLSLGISLTDDTKWSWQKASSLYSMFTSKT